MLTKQNSKRVLAHDTQSNHLLVKWIFKDGPSRHERGRNRDCLVSVNPITLFYDRFPTTSLVASSKPKASWIPYSASPDIQWVPIPADVVSTTRLAISPPFHSHRHNPSLDARSLQLVSYSHLLTLSLPSAFPPPNPFETTGILISLIHSFDQTTSLLKNVHRPSTKQLNDFATLTPTCSVLMPSLLIKCVD